MEKKKLTKENLVKIVLGDYTPDENREILDTDEIGSMLYHEWQAQQHNIKVHKTDFRHILEKIRSRTHPERNPGSASSQFFIREIEDLRLLNRKLRNRSRIWLSIAASLMLVFGLGSLIFLSQTRLLEKSVTENIAPYGQKSQVVLPDGTKVFLNSGTVLRYDNRFGRQHRKLELAGEAFFVVTPGKKLPFFVYTSDVEIKVTGTQFNVMAYPEESFIETTVTEGTVQVREIHGEASLTLTASQNATYSKSQHKLMHREVNPASAISWKENVLYFDNENFEHVIKKLERWYNVTITLKGKDSIDDRFTLTIKNEGLREVLDLIRLTTPIDYMVKENQVTISYNK
jgi:ferric-dicitrate binding protein FerR (iron transport regulator)